VRCGRSRALWGEIERHWIEVSHRDVFIPGLPPAFDGFRIAQLSDIHWTNSLSRSFLRDASNRVNRLNPDAVFLTGDFVTGVCADEICRRCRVAMRRIFSISSPAASAMRCLGNHDVLIGARGHRRRSPPTHHRAKTTYMPHRARRRPILACGLDDPLAGLARS
jgi:predicted MPP superfamily phosphohydrolase